MQRKVTALPRSIAGIALGGAMLVRFLTPQIGDAQTKSAQSENSSASQRSVAAMSPYIDVHTHLDESDVGGSMQSAIDSMLAENLAKIVFMPSPFTLADANRFDVERLAPAATQFPGKIALLGGGGTLNFMIIEAARMGNAGAEVQKKFKERA